jgi:hypothetical protein
VIVQLQNGGSDKLLSEAIKDTINTRFEPLPEDYLERLERLQVW